MDDESRAVYVGVCGRVERVDVPGPELTLEALCAAVSTRFDIGDRLRFVSDEEGDPEVTTDEHLKEIARGRQTLRVLISDTALSDLEQRMWQLRQLQWGFFQDELARLKNSMGAGRSEMRQLRQALEQSARREVELTGELMNERRLREKGEAAGLERHEVVCAEIRREQRARDSQDAAMRKDLEDCRQAGIKFAANADRQVTDVKGLLSEESRNRGKNIEALLAEWAGSQAEIRQAMEGVRSDIERSMQDAERQAKGLLREASAREAFEQFFGEKIRSVELVIGKFEGTSTSLDQRLTAVVQEAQEATRAEAAERAAGDQELQWVLSEIREEAARHGNLIATANKFGLEGGSMAMNMPMQQPLLIGTGPCLAPSCSSPTAPRFLQEGHPAMCGSQGSLPATAPGRLRATTPPPPSVAVMAPPQQQQQLLREVRVVQQVGQPPFVGQQRAKVG